METFYVIGAVLAGWGLLVSFLGIVRDGFPGSRGAELAVAAISVALVAGAIGSAAIGAANEGADEDEGGHAAALVLPA
ncbi:MAG: hypothetical protein WD993_00130 [Thermoleophilaceae bacterium]